MTNPIMKIVNAQTGEEIEREMTDIEFAEYLENEKIYKEKESEREKAAKEIAKSRQILLDKLGITEEEAKLLLG